MPGDPAPWFVGRTRTRPDYAFNTVAGRYVVLGFVDSSRSASGQALIAAIAACRPLLDDVNLTCFGVTTDLEDEAEGRVEDQIPGVRWFFDTDCRISAEFGLVGPDGKLEPAWVVLDPALRAVAVGPMSEAGMLAQIAARLPPPGLHAGVELPAPVLTVPRVFEPELCRRLIERFDAHGGDEARFTTESGGRTKVTRDREHKSRLDYLLDDPEAVAQCQLRLQRRLVPEIAKAFQFNATRIERQLIGRYDAARGDLFRPHRDNTARGTAHRRFAVTLNLNAEDYEGGELRFPEFGMRTYKPPTGGATVFSCSLMHEALPVIRGVRYVYLPFLYDEAGAAQRLRNNAHLDESVEKYAPVDGPEAGTTP